MQIPLPDIYKQPFTLTVFLVLLWKHVCICDSVVCTVITLDTLILFLSDKSFVTGHLSIQTRFTAA